MFSSHVRTFGVVEGVHVSSDVALQVGVEAGRGGEEGQADGHQLPAALQAVVAEVLRGLAAQLDVQLVSHALVAPATRRHLVATWWPGERETERERDRERHQKL